MQDTRHLNWTPASKRDTPVRFLNEPFPSAGSGGGGPRLSPDTYRLGEPRPTGLPADVDNPPPIVFVEEDNKWLNDFSCEKSMNELAAKQCVPCKGGVPPLSGKALEELQTKLGAGWQVAREHHLEKEFAFKNFREALAFTNRIGELAETQNHHPDICLAWGKVKVTIWTHKIDGLTESDFVFAAKVEHLFAGAA